MRVDHETGTSMTDLQTARTTGILFIVASVSAVVGGGLIYPTVDDNYLVEAQDHGSRIVTGALGELVLAMAVVAIAVMLYPVLKRRNEGLALAYVGARTLEGVLILATTVSSLLVLSLSRGQGSAGEAGAVPLGEVLVAAREWTYWLGPSLMFSVSALILYALLFRAKLVPTWLSVWGFVGGLLLIGRTLVEMYGRELPVSVLAVTTAPIGLNEMVLAVWLMIKGFSNRSPVVGAGDNPSAPFG